MTALRENVPVFNCVVHVAPPDADGAVVATVANLPGLIGRGRSEREALAQVVPQFKAAVARYHAAGEPIPWIDPPVVCPPGSVQRLIAVHL
jgi:predicted RNase H-like HicB family nuclease